MAKIEIDVTGLKKYVWKVGFFRRMLYIIQGEKVITQPSFGGWISYYPRYDIFIVTTNCPIEIGNNIKIQHGFNIGDYY